MLSIKQINQPLLSNVSVEHVQQKLEKYATSQIAHFNSILQSNEIANAFNGHIEEEEFQTLSNVPYALFLFKKDALFFWNSNTIAAPEQKLAFDIPIPFIDKNGQYIWMKKRVGDSSLHQYAVAAILLKYENNLSPKYCRKNFAVGDNENDYGIKMSLTKVPNSVCLTIQGVESYYIYSSNPFFIIYDINGWRLFFNALPFIFFGISIHTYFKVKVTIQKKNPIFIFSLLLFTAFVLRASTYLFGFPDDFSQYTMFQSSYFTMDKINRSLGDVFINLCLLFWIVIFFVVNVQGKIVDITKQLHKTIVGLVYLVFAFGLSSYLCFIANGIIIHSGINFDANLFNQLDVFSFIGLLCFLLIFSILLLLIISTNYYFETWVQQKYKKYIYLSCVFTFLFFLLRPLEIEFNLAFVFCNFLFFLIILDIPFFKTKFDFNSFALLLWVVFLSISCSIYFTFTIIEKEKIFRQQVAKKIISQKDTVTDERIERMANQIQGDSNIKKYLLQQKSLDGFYYYFNQTYQISFPSNVNVRVLWNQKEFPLLQDTSRSAKVIRGDSNKQDAAQILKTDDNYTIPILLGKEVMGNLCMTVEKNSLGFTDDHLNILEDDIFYTKVHGYKYSYAIYEDSILEEKSGNYIFFNSIQPHQLFKDKYVHFENVEDKSILYYHLKNNLKNVVIVKQTKIFYLFSTIFAYMFFIYFLTITLYVLGNMVARSNLIYNRFLNLLSLNLRLRIHASILVVVLLSFAAVGVFTSHYLIQRVNERSQTEVSNHVQLIQKELLNYYHTHMMMDSSSVAEVRKIMEDISKKYSLNIDLFELQSGKLFYSSNPVFYKDKILSGLMNYTAKFELDKLNREYIMQDESIFNIKYYASYSILYDRNGKAIAYMQLPYLSETTQITSENFLIILALINIYVFVFILSFIFALSITYSVVRPFTYVIKQFTRINLTKTNQPLKWNYSDEIGLLVKEYNRMLRTMENTTVLLAKSEREMAWREMAKQVAHEIKNPLTPMKLSLQMLERAIKNKKSNIEEMTAQMTNTMIEQIDNLTLIATNFSDFAKLPEQNKEVTNLSELLHSITGMYFSDLNFEYSFVIPEYPIFVYADKGQLIRVFTNILQNANQAIPENKLGVMSVTVSKIIRNSVRISISDNGEGIDAERGKSLFEPYFTTKSSGTGLGLAMCKDIVEQSGGKITYTSVVHVGTTFNIDLPIYMPEEGIN